MGSTETEGSGPQCGYTIRLLGVALPVIHFVKQAGIEMSTAVEDAESEGEVLRVRKIGNSIGVILPKALLARIGLKEGDKLHVVEGADRALKLTPYDPTHAKAMEIARRSFRDYANTYKTLAK